MAQSYFGRAIFEFDPRGIGVSIPGHQQVVRYNVFERILRDLAKYAAVLEGILLDPTAELFLTLDSCRAVAPFMIIHIINLYIDQPEIILNPWLRDIKILKNLNYFLIDKLDLHPRVPPVHFCGGFFHPLDRHTILNQFKHGVIFPSHHSEVNSIHTQHINIDSLIIRAQSHQPVNDIDPAPVAGLKDRALALLVNSFKIHFFCIGQNVINKQNVLSKFVGDATLQQCPIIEKNNV